MGATAVWQQIGGLAVVLAAIWAIARRHEVRLTLLCAAFVLSLLAHPPAQFFSAETPAALAPVVRTFLSSLADEKFVVPICSALAFAYVLHHTGCDQHLVLLLVKPLSRVKMLLVPGTVLVGFLVNIPIVSQTGTAATLGPVVIPVLRGAGVGPLTAAAALLVGSSLGGELLNPGAPELLRTVEECKKAAHRTGTEGSYNTRACIQRILPLVLLALAIATLALWGLSLRHDDAPWQQPAQSPPPDFRVRPLRAMVPVLPLVFLYLVAPPLQLVHIPAEWLEVVPAGATAPLRTETRLIGLSMLLGTAAAALVVPERAGGIAAAFFEGAGYAYAHIISLIVTANCFGEAVRAIGFGDQIGRFIAAYPDGLIPSAALLPFVFACLCGSGIASTQSLVGFYIAPAFALGADPLGVGAVVSIASALGRTSSPVAAVVLFCASATGVSPIRLVRRVVLPLTLALAAVVVAAMLRG